MEILAIVLALHRCNVDEKPVFIVSSVCLSVCLSVLRKLASEIFQDFQLIMVI